MEQNIKSISVLFEYSLDQKQPTLLVVKLKGAFRRGHQDPTSVLKFLGELPNIEKLASRGVVIFDINELTFWDTLGIKAVVQTIIDINKSHGKRSGILAKSKEGTIYEAAVDKFNEIKAGVVPWELSKDRIVEVLTT